MMRNEKDKFNEIISICLSSRDSEKRWLIYLILYFLSDGVKKVGIRWIQCVGEHEILPDHDAQFVSQVVEIFRLVHLCHRQLVRDWLQVNTRETHFPQ